MKGLTKAEVSQLLQESGLPYSPDWNLDELRQILQENMFLKGRSAAQREMKGFNSLTKSQLIAKATELGADTTPYMTKPSLKLAIRQAILQKHAPESTDFMGFGEHSGLTYQQVRDQHPEYMDRCKAETGPGSCWQMARFASWLGEQAVRSPGQGMTGDPREVPGEPTQARGGARSSRRRTMDPEQESSNQLMQQQIKLDQLIQRVNKLEAQPPPADPEAKSSASMASSQSGQAAG